MLLPPVSEAAERLGVWTRQVQHLVAQRELRALASGQDLQRGLAVGAHLSSQGTRGGNTQPPAAESG